MPQIRIDTIGGTQHPSTVTITDNQGIGNQITGLESGSLMLQAQHDPVALTATDPERGSLRGRGHAAGRSWRIPSGSTRDNKVWIPHT